VALTGGLTLERALTALTPANPPPTTTTRGDPFRFLALVIAAPASRPDA
jgi:hypothetical protein